MIRGQTARLSVTFLAGATPTDPTAVTFRYSVDGDTPVVLVYGVDGALVRDSAGVYHVDRELTVGGTWAYRWEGTGAVVAAAESSFVVDAGAFA